MIKNILIATVLYYFFGAYAFSDWTWVATISSAHSRIGIIIFYFFSIIMTGFGGAAFRELNKK